MKRVYVIALLLFSVNVFSQSLISQYQNVKGWKGQFKMTVVESEPGTGVTYTTTAEGPATLMNPNVQTPIVLNWPQPNFSNTQVPDLSNLNPSDPNYVQQLQAAMQASQSVNNEFLQWDAKVSFKYESKANEFPVDVRDITCNYTGSKKSQLTISIYTNEKKETIFAVKGVVMPAYEQIKCSGSVDGQVINSKEELLNPSELRYTGEATSTKKLNTKINTIADTVSYTEGNKKVTITYSFTAIL